MSNANIITQVSPETLGRQPIETDQNIDMSSIIKLNIRGELFQITRDALMNLPESILLCLFPNGVFLDKNNHPIQNLDENHMVYVNFDPICFKYIIDSFANAAKRLPVNSKTEAYDPFSTPDVKLLDEKPAIIVLREDLDYYVIPPKKGIHPQSIKMIKAAAGQYLVQQKKVFDGLGYGPGKNLGPAEEHLLDMLCSSGFSTDSEWGHRTSEPGKTVLISLALVDLKTLERPSEPVPPASPSSSAQSLDPVPSNSSQKQSRKSKLAELTNNTAKTTSRSVSGSRNQKHGSAGTAAKLLLFWRKPARKCWWSTEMVQLSIPGIMVGDEKIDAFEVNLHIRRVWTLELSVIGVH